MRSENRQQPGSMEDLTVNDDHAAEVKGGPRTVDSDIRIGVGELQECTISKA